MFNSEYIECIVNTYQYKSIFVIAQLVQKCHTHLSIHVCDDCAIRVYRTAQNNGGGNFGKFGELHIIQIYFLPDYQIAKKFALKFTQLYVNA